jgi:hypothetical protein
MRVPCLLVVLFVMGCVVASAMMHRGGSAWWKDYMITYHGAR